MSFLNLTGDALPEARAALQPGTYTLKVDEAEVKETQLKTGKYIKLKLKVASGPSQGSVVFHNFNISNPSEQAQQIGRSELKQFCLASGTPLVLESVSQLVGKIVIAKTKIEKDNKDRDQAKVVEFIIDSTPKAETFS